ncbi:hypothetical protein RF11_13500 [Thelohanellus kitauei]|uniref:Uncharacterized protein n=1 Tax=Thelohanellus kitauei TaxID=669202 RepID=A0A0C2J2J2_THEKT|nr:hypothetical protein RF11_13500 [Thelohanellus kitauei]
MLIEICLFVILLFPKQATGEDDIENVLIYRGSNYARSISSDKIIKAVDLGVKVANYTHQLSINTLNYQPKSIFLKDLVRTLKKTPINPISETIILVDPDEFYAKNYLSFDIYMGLLNYKMYRHSDLEKATFSNLLDFNPANIVPYTLPYLLEKSPKIINIYIDSKFKRLWSDITSEDGTEIRFVENKPIDAFKADVHVILSEFSECLEQTARVFRGTKTFVCFSDDILTKEIGVSLKAYDFKQFVIQKINDVLSRYPQHFRNRILQNLLIFIPKIDSFENFYDYAKSVDRNLYLTVRDILFLCDLTVLSSYLTAQKFGADSNWILTNGPCGRLYLKENSIILPYFDVWSLNQSSSVMETVIKNSGDYGFDPFR